MDRRLQWMQKDRMSLIGSRASSPRVVLIRLGPRVGWHVLIVCDGRGDRRVEATMPFQGVPPARLKIGPFATNLQWSRTLCNSRAALFTAFEIEVFFL